MFQNWFYFVPRHLEVRSISTIMAAAAAAVATAVAGPMRSRCSAFSKLRPLRRLTGCCCSSPRPPLWRRPGSSFIYNRRAHYSDVASAVDDVAGPAKPYYVTAPIFYVNAGVYTLCARSVSLFNSHIFPQEGGPLAIYYLSPDWLTYYIMSFFKLPMSAICTQ